MHCFQIGIWQQLVRLRPRLGIKNQSLSAYICQHVNYGSGVNSISNVMGGLMLVFFILPNRHSPVPRFYLNLPNCCCTCPSSGHAVKADNYKLRLNANNRIILPCAPNTDLEKRNRYKTTFSETERRRNAMWLAGWVSYCAPPSKANHGYIPKKSGSPTACSS